ncbi:MAG: alcohol dehydrogenase catalytic domain-containing protein [Defluviitaleaceae bacterium]|nr:alcohol dehydrogenase catalytic domain-containing protein [Defluviitaleaceae bacterium]
MKRIIMTGPMKSAIKEVPNPVIGDDHVLIKLKYVGVCMSEHNAWTVAKEGDVFGHEPMGVIEKVGKNITAFKPGDRVSGSWGGSLPGSGGMVQYAAADPKTEIVVKLPDNVRDEDLVLEPLACMMSAVSKVRCNMPNTPVAVIGCGYMGCGLISLLRLRGAYVVGIDNNAASLANAKLYGANETCTVEDAWKKYKTKMQWDYVEGDFLGFDSVMEWAEDEEALDLAINIVKECGQVCVGAYHTGKKVLLDMDLHNWKAADLLSTHPREADLNVKGCNYAAQMLSNGMWGYKNLPVKIYPMGKFDLAQTELKTKYGKYMKALIDMTKEDGEPYII